MSKALALTSRDRRGYLGSADIAAVLGLSPWKTPYMLWEEKTASKVPKDDDKAMYRRGRRAEPYIIEWLQEERDFWVIDRNLRVTHPVYPFLAAESDFTYVISKGNVYAEDSDTTEEQIRANLGHGECKSVGEFADWSKWGPEGSQDVPDYYLVQALFALECNGMSETTIAGGFGWDNVRTYLFERNRELGEAIIQRAVDFWNLHVIPKVPPPTETSEDALRSLKRFGSFTWQASPEAIEQVAAIKSIQAEIKALESRLGSEKKAFFDMFVAAAEVHGIMGTELKKASAVGSDGKPIATLTEINKKAFSVKASTYIQVRFAGGSNVE